MGIYIYIYVCHASAHALRMRRIIIIIITCTCNGSPWFSSKVWHTAAFSRNLREASALMRISSYFYTYGYPGIYLQFVERSFAR